jgi:hypothetical protein
MKLFRLMLSVVVISFSTVAFAQSDAQKSFDTMKSLAGTWEGTFEGTPTHVSLRVTSMGNALIHKMRGEGKPDDPISMINMDGARLLMTHYCDAGNQPRFVGTTSPDGKTVTFDFVDGTNLLSTQDGHMQHVVFHIIDADHHTELWQFAMADGKEMGGLLDLKRAK